MGKEVEILKRALERERKARREAEKILEDKSLQLFNINKELEDINDSLELELEKRSKTIVELAKFPEQNPNPVLRFDLKFNCIYSNSGAEFIRTQFGKSPEVWAEFKIGRAHV